MSVLKTGTRKAPFLLRLWWNRVASHTAGIWRLGLSPDSKCCSMAGHNIPAKMRKNRHELRVPASKSSQYRDGYLGDVFQMELIFSTYIVAFLPCYEFES